jgi:hypothetical protein
MQSTDYSSRILMKLESSRQIKKKVRISNFIKIRPVGAALFHAADRHDEANSRSMQFCESA